MTAGEADAYSRPFMTAKGPANWADGVAEVDIFGNSTDALLHVTPSVDCEKLQGLSGEFTGTTYPPLAQVAPN